MSYIAKDERIALSKSDLPTDTPFLIGYVSSGFFSIARHYGGIIYNKKHYMYFQDTDELVRDDVLKWLRRYRENQRRRLKIITHC